jgi:hypothetical protein
MRLSRLEHRRLGQLIRAAVRQAHDAHPERFTPMTWRQLAGLANSIGKRAVGAIKSELRNERGTGTKGKPRGVRSGDGAEE